MIPMMMVLKVETPDARPIRLWIPLILIWILVAPLVLLLIPFALVAALVIGINPFNAIASLAAIFTALSDTCVEVDTPDARVFFLVK